MHGGRLRDVGIKREADGYPVTDACELSLLSATASEWTTPTVLCCTVLCCTYQYCTYYAVGKSLTANETGRVRPATDCKLAPGTPKSARARPLGRWIPASRKKIFQTLS